MSLTFAIIQYNFNVGFIAGNVARISALYGLAAAGSADLVVFSEMAITGYPPEDLVLSERFQELSMEAVDELALLTARGSAMLVGGLWREGDALYNAVFLLDGGKILHRQYKHHLPNYGVFDEKRVFERGPMPEPVEWHGVKLGLLICEDMWLPDVAKHLKAKGAELLICINASPYEVGKATRREAIAAKHAQETELPLLYVNQVGGQDDLVFDGGSFALNALGQLCLRMHAFKEDLTLLQWTKHNKEWQCVANAIKHKPDDLESMYHAMMLGLRDFVQKNGYQGVVIGISGGIDSVLSSVIAADALGGDRVHMIMLPSPVTSRESIEDATECAKRIGARLDTVPIEPGMKAFDEMLHPFVDDKFHIRAANNQTRIRASILLAISTQEKALLLTTGNKSELATGFMQLYGDMSGHYCVLKDIYKTTEYKLAHWRNAQSEVIPAYVLTRPPSGETVPNQTDQDILPPYELLDEILFRMVEQQLSVEEVVAQGFEREVVDLVCSMLFGSEYKRRQSAPGVKLTSMSFGRDRRYPITSVWRAKKLLLPSE
jgi:NAD+ synthase